jgi:hypothetical protein
VGLFALGSQPAAAVEYAREVRFTTRDDPASADPAYDDSAWQRALFWQLPKSDGVLWARAVMTIESNDRQSGSPLGVAIGAMASHELYWDGELVGRGGVVGATAAAETPGPIQALYALPDRLSAPGAHQVAVRFSAHHRGFEPHTGYWHLVAGPYDRLLVAQRSSAEIALVALSGIVMMAIFALVLWLQDRRERSSLLLALLSAIAAALLWAESWRALFGYTYDWQIVRLRAVTALAWLLGLGLLAFLADRFPMSGSRWLLGAGLLGVTVPAFSFRAWDPRAVVALLVVFALALLWTLRAMRARLPGSGLVTLGLAICLGALLWEPGLFLDRNLYLALNGLFLALLVAHARQVARARREHDAAGMRSARLEIELLKRQLQPHFLMNTLTALSEWLEEDPPTAGRMVQALAAELRLLGEISDRRLIPLADELALCRCHLAVMGLRTGDNYRLEVSGGEGELAEAVVPPAMLHTLVENAVTHRNGAAAGEVLVLRLNVERARASHRERDAAGRQRRLRFVLEAPLAAGDVDGPIHEGTGLRYVRARLNESFGTDWSLAFGPSEGVWRTTIELPSAGSAAG